ncbi:5-cytosine rRNA methyltransferase NSUN4 [Scleropages formosus]|uniref:5-cytosine rRNA methyltransferase NSUN4 n=1 Tax=Scleropages formosus TaxID=113540 RepID=A0A8C9RH87_SCLFO|nr:5-methylcytosine rRNA methyltransferase NSUN4 [Scleropages formosus]
MAALSGTKTLLLRALRGFGCVVPRRQRVKTKWAATLPRIPATSLALHNFDVNYGLQFGDLWPSVRVAMLCEQKYGALINNFSDVPGLLSELRFKGARDFVQSGRSLGEGTGGAGRLPGEGLTPATGSTEEESMLPEMSPNIRCFVFPKGDIARFKPARPDSCGTLSYYLLDAASLLPVLALDVREGHTVLDLCAAPGGKTLALLQTHAISQLTVNDVSESRMNRVRRTLQSYLPREVWSGNRVAMTTIDGQLWGEMARSTFDRVLVDVPCTTDRHSVMEEENNIFKKMRTKERQKLPALQTQLLVAGMEATRPGGVVLYSTCTLSQLQNEMVVEQAMHVAQDERGVTVEVEDLGPLERHFESTFHFAPRQRLGLLVIPHLTANFGPTYLCKLRRVR